MKNSFMMVLFSILLFSSAWFPLMPVSVYAVAPNAPTGLTATGISQSQINLSWTASTLPSGINATGGIITTFGNQTIHSFKNSGTYAVTAGSGRVSVLVVAGGGAGGAGGGGGSGGVIINSSYPISPGNYTVTVGAGGTGTSSGSNSVFGVLTAIGGGAGGGNNGGPGSSGGSGGGGGYNTQGGSGYAGGSGTAGQGYPGGAGMTNAGGINVVYSGGGGGPGGPGGGGGGGCTGVQSSINYGGSGIASSITGSSVFYGGGGGGAGYGCGGTGGSGNGGAGSHTSGAGGTGGDGVTNTGGGGGGEYAGTGGAGGSGIVIISEDATAHYVTGYKIERSLNNSTWNTIVANTTTTATTYSNTGLSASTTYYYRVSALNADGTSLPSNVSSATTLNPPPPPAPTLNSITQVSSTALTPNWSSSTGATWYQVNRTSPSGGTLVNIANVTTLSYADSGLVAGTQYQYGIQAGNASGHGGISNNLSRYTIANDPTSMTFTNPTISGNTTGERVGWTNPTGNYSSFKISYECPLGSGYIVASADTGNTTSRYDLAGLPSSTLCSVKVQTIYAKGSSDQGITSGLTSSFTTGGGSGGSGGITSINGNSTAFQNFLGILGNVTITNNGSTHTYNLGSNVVVTNGAAQTISKQMTFGYNINIGGNITSTAPSGNTFKITAPAGVAICIGTGC